MSFINNDENFLQYLYFVCMKHTLADCRHFTFSAMCSTILQQQICLVVCFVNTCSWTFVQSYCPCLWDWYWSAILIFYFLCEWIYGLCGSNRLQVYTVYFTFSIVFYSLFQDIISPHLEDFFFMKIHIPVKEVQLKLNERENFQVIFIDTLLFFTQKNSQEQKKISYRIL